MPTYTDQSSLPDLSSRKLSPSDPRSPMPTNGNKPGAAPVVRDERQERRRRIIEALQGRDLEQAVAKKSLWDDIQKESESNDPDKLITPDGVKAFKQARAHQLAERSLGLFFSTDDVIIVPGLMGSELVDESGKDGLIWVDP